MSRDFPGILPTTFEDRSVFEPLRRDSMNRHFRIKDIKSKYERSPAHDTQFREEKSSSWRSCAAALTKHPGSCGNWGLKDAPFATWPQKGLMWDGKEINSRSLSDWRIEVLVWVSLFSKQNIVHIRTHHDRWHKTARLAVHRRTSTWYGEIAVVCMCRACEVNGGYHAALHLHFSVDGLERDCLSHRNEYYVEHTSQLLSKGRVAHWQIPNPAAGSAS